MLVAPVKIDSPCRQEAEFWRSVISSVYEFTARAVTLQVRYQAGTGPTLIKTSERLFAGIATSSSSSSP